jgi:hypothetical protein
VTFTGIGQELVLVTECGRAVWAVVRQRTPSKAGSGATRGRNGTPDDSTVFVWRNSVFRNLGAGLSSWLIQWATEATYRWWPELYGEMPRERLRTEIKIAAVRSRNPGACYQLAGWERGERRRGIQFFYAAPAAQIDAEPASR